MSINHLYGRSLIFVRLSAERIHRSGHLDQYLNCFHFWSFQKAQKERIDRSINATDSGHVPALGGDVHFNEGQTLCSCRPEWKTMIYDVPMHHCFHTSCLLYWAYFVNGFLFIGPGIINLHHIVVVCDKRNFLELFSHNHFQSFLWPVMEQNSLRINCPH